MEQAPQELDVRSARIEIIEQKMKHLRMLAVTGDRDANQGIKLAMESAPFFREHGQEIIDLLKGDA